MGLNWPFHVNKITTTTTLYGDVMMRAMASQITNLTFVCSDVYSSAGQRIYQSSTPLALVRGIQWWPVNSLHKGPVTRKMFQFDDVIMLSAIPNDIAEIVKTHSEYLMVPFYVYRISIQINSCEYELINHVT